MVPSKLVIAAWAADLEQERAQPKNTIPVLTLSSSKGELLPMEEAGAPCTTVREEGREEEGGARSLKLSSIASCSDRETPDLVDSGDNSRSSSVASVEMTFSDVASGESDCEMAVPEGRSELHSPQSAAEDDVFLAT